MDFIYFQTLDNSEQVIGILDHSIYIIGLMGWRDYIIGQDLDKIKYFSIQLKKGHMIGLADT
jgi:hypothetical protein